MKGFWIESVLALMAAIMVNAAVEQKPNIIFILADDLVCNK